MKGSQWSIVFLVVALASFFGGYTYSAKTGVEPGYLDAVEAAGYGAGGGAKIEGVTDEMSNYYQDLMNEDE